MSELVMRIKDFYPDLLVAINAYIDTEQKVKEMISFLENNPTVNSSVATLKSMDIGGYE